MNSITHSFGFTGGGWYSCGARVGLGTLFSKLSLKSKFQFELNRTFLFSLLQVFSARSGMLVATFTYLAFLENFLEFVLRFCGFESDGEMLHLRFLLRVVHGIPTKRRFRTEKQQIYLLKETSIMCIKGFFNTSNRGVFCEKANFGFLKGIKMVLWKGKFWPKFSQNLPLQPKFAFSQNHRNMPKNWNLWPFEL